MADERAIFYSVFAAAAIAIAVTAATYKPMGREVMRHNTGTSAVDKTQPPSDNSPAWADIPKGDRLPQFEDEPRIVRTIPVAPLFRPLVSNPRFEPLPEPVIAQTEFPSLPQPKITKPKGDVCARHGMKRQDDGKRWHCVKK
jgi:hypothetical protein